MIKFLILFSICFVGIAEDDVTKFPIDTPVIMLNEDNFDSETGLGINI